MGYEQFCEKPVMEDLIKKSRLHICPNFYKKFIQIVQSRRQKFSLQKFRLKQQLMKSYHQLVFVTPSHRNVGEIVLTENLCTKDIVRDGEYADTSCDGGDDRDHENDGNHSRTQSILN